jgi:type I restriction enzyme M protein
VELSDLDISWLEDESGDPEDMLTEPEDIIAAIMGHLHTALEEGEGISEELNSVTDAPKEAA